MLGAICGLLAGYFSPSDSKPKGINKTAISLPYIRSAAAPYWLLAFILPFLLLPLARQIMGLNRSCNFFANFYQTGSLVFGGGHVILPLLHQDFVTTGLVSAQSFDLGYAFAQLMPGPFFSFASYIGALLPWTPYAWLNTLLQRPVQSFYLHFS